MTEFELSKIDPISAGKISAAMYMVMGLLFVLIYSPFMLLFLLVDASAVAIIGGLVVGLIMAAIGIVFYALMGFVMGALMAYFYNFVAGRFGGLEVEFEEK